MRMEKAIGWMAEPANDVNHVDAMTGLFRFFFGDDRMLRGRKGPLMVFALQLVFQSA